MDHHNGWAAEEFSPKTGVNFGENKNKINILDVLTRKTAWLTGFLLFCVQIDNGDLLYVV